MRKFILALVPVLLLTFASEVSHAGEIMGIDRYRLREPFPAEFIAPPYTPLRKLGNGLLNVSTGWLELPFLVAAEGTSALHEERSLFVGGFVGLVYGVPFAIARTTYGVLEISTFWIHFGFEPVMTPETVYGLNAHRD